MLDQACNVCGGGLRPSPLIKYMKKIIFILILILVVSTAYAKNYSITFGWDKNTEADLAGYKLYRRDQAADYSHIADISEDLSTYTTSIDMNITTYFVLTAFDDSGNESDYSNEVTYTIDNIAPSSPQSLTIKSISIIIDF